MAFDGFRADSFFGDEFYGDTEEVMEEPPFLGIEVIKGGDDAGVVKAIVPEPLPDVGPVFLFDVGVVIFVIGPASGELEGYFSLGKMSQEVIVEELTSIITVEAKDRKGEGFFDIVHLFKDACFSLSPDGTLFGPPGGDIDEVEGIDIHSGSGITAVGNGIGFEKAGT